MNVVMTGDRKFVEVQGTAEGAPFDREQLETMLALAVRGLRRPGRDPAERARGMSRLFLASRNPKKLEELRRIIGGSVPGVDVVGLDDVSAYDEPDETEPTFEGNALIKARAGLQATGLPTLADDSGLCVDALNEMPGVLSARWAGRAKDDAANNALLLDQLSDVPDERRAARFRCAVAFATPAGSESVVIGEMPGRIIRETRGANGFGYDVVFVPEGEDRTSAQMSDDDKDAISHRGKALRAIAPMVAGALRA